jgi:hypothetical protein
MAGELLPAESTAFVIIVKKAFKPAYDENDELLISSWGALRNGLEALLKEDGSDPDRADKSWGKAFAALVAEENNMVGAAAQGSLQVEDTYDMEQVGG